MSLASASPGGGGNDDLKNDKAVWSRAGSDVAAVAVNVRKALGQLESRQKGATITGVESAGAQRELYASWKRYLEGVAGRCSSLQGPLERAGKDQYANDHDIGEDLQRVTKKYVDTPATGGSSSGGR
ncbi:hypothetical protein [Streptomyces sp. CC228A]|uniref:hypothetical protein n=1 Tax=Streptomyces sp. CC228A TaxID=2898186 RepID=UPI001F1849F2|nr:hypothetical protein [Streptomyces sp. CC228A]